MRRQSTLSKNHPRRRTSKTDRPLIEIAFYSVASIAGRSRARTRKRNIRFGVREKERVHSNHQKHRDDELKVYVSEIAWSDLVRPHSLALNVVYLIAAQLMEIAMTTAFASLTYAVDYILGG